MTFDVTIIDSIHISPMRWYITHKPSASKTVELTSGVARAFPGGRLAHPEGQSEEENEKSLRKSKKKIDQI